ncbi:MAG: NIPSNAP family protein [Acidobacteriaceae bacterium]|nr:NIPSNAP family protein [Acidobacteriaceae bacterium]MBV9780080.1 NIPSNAP family protein [Acidobacteriaceae bacterium]
MSTRIFCPIAALVLFIAGYCTGSVHSTVHAQTGNRVFELRTYHAYDGKLDPLLARFRDHTVSIFNKHGMTSVGYWLPTDEPLKGKTLIYMLAFPSREGAAKSWAEFHDDPEWKRVAAASEANGKLVQKVDSILLEPADFSAIS